MGAALNLGAPGGLRKAAQALWVQPEPSTELRHHQGRQRGDAKASYCLEGTSWKPRRAEGSTWEDHSHCPLDREIHLGSVNEKMALTKSIAND